MYVSNKGFPFTGCTSPAKSEISLPFIKTVDPVSVTIVTTPPNAKSGPNLLIAAILFTIEGV